MQNDQATHSSILFRHTIFELIKTFEIEEIVETGTYLGLGSTKIFADTRLPIVSIECNHNHFLQALINRPEQYVTIKYGLSLQRKQIEDFLDLNYFLKDFAKQSFPHVLFDNYTNGKEFYTKEIFDNLIEPYNEDLLIKSINNKNQLIYLDSAGGIGFLEVSKLLQFLYSFNNPFNIENKVLILDDVNHIKHYASASYLKDFGLNMNYSADLRFAWCHFMKEKYGNSQ